MRIISIVEEEELHGQVNTDRNGSTRTSGDGRDKNVAMKAADVGSGFQCMLAMIGTRGLKDKYYLRT